VTYVVAIVGLLVLVLIHELGHFSAAKAVGMRALRFSIGFPPAVLKRQVGDTEYVLGAIPLGGYVRIPGMLRPDASDLGAVEDMLDRNEELTDEQAAAIAGALDSASRALSRGRPDTAGEELAELRAAVAAAGDSVPAGWRRRIERSIERVSASLDPRSYWRSSRRSRLLVIAAGPLANVLACFVLLSVLAVTGQPGPADTTVARIVAGSPAQRMGLRPGDVVLSVNGVHGGWQRLRSQIMSSDGRPVTVVVRRNGRALTLPRERPIPLQGAYRLGFDFGQSLVHHSVLDAPAVALSQMWQLTDGTLGALGDVTSSKGRAQLHSTVGIVQYSAVAASDGTPYYLSLLAYISLSVAIINLLPFLPLDGGHILMIAIERLRGGRTMSRATLERISAVGIVLILLVFVIGLQNDINSIAGSTH
jgi:regulator of sigma E protease